MQGFLPQLALVQVGCVITFDKPCLMMLKCFYPQNSQRRMGIPYLRQKLVVGDCAVPLHASWEDGLLLGLTTPEIACSTQDLDRPREVELCILDYVRPVALEMEEIGSPGNHLGIHVMATCTSFEML